MVEQSGLERFHGPLTAAFPSAVTAAERERWRLDPQQVAEFGERGFLSDLPLLSPSEVEELRARLGRIGQRLSGSDGLLYEVESGWRERPDEVVLHFLGAWRVDEWFHDLVFHPGATVRIAQLLGVERLRFWHDQVFWKPARHAGVVPWHQDYSYWTRTAPARHLTMFIALDDMDEQSGALHYVPGSQRWGLLPKVDFGGDLEQLHAHLTPEQRAAFRPEPVRMKAGRAAIHHSHLVHGSFANTADRPRRAVVLNYMHAATRAAGGSQPLLAHVPPIDEGELVDGPFFPIVLNPSV